MADSSKKFGLMSRKVLLGTTLGAALFFMIVGVIFWGGFNTAMEATNSLDFCISCHEMEENVYQEYRKTVHFTNRSGVRATCSDCHVPDPWVHKVIRKVQASNEVLHKVLGTIDTPEKFDAKRLQLAKNVWKAMKKTDSRECRNCHDFGTMNPKDQKPRSRGQHINGMEAGNTCIDCHKGIAHSKVHDQLTDEELTALEKPNLANKRPIPPQWQVAIDEIGKGKKKGKKAKAKPAAKAAPEAVATAVETAVDETAAMPAEAPDAESQLVAAPAAATAAVASGSNPADKIDWSSIEPLEATLFYPGQASMEWSLKGSDHGGKRAFVTGDRCFDCHAEEGENIGDLIVSGEKVEPTPIPGKRGSIVVDIQAAHDAENLYMRFKWDDTEHAPNPHVDGGKMDPENPVKLAIMLTSDSEEDPKVEFAERAGCWQTCHHDANYMPDAPDQATLSGSPVAQRIDLTKGVTKYLKESRTEIEIEGREGAKRGGWDKLRTDEEIQAALDNGSFMDLLRFKAGTGESEDGYILAERVMTGGQGVTFTGELKDGKWTVLMTRKLVSDKAGDISLALDQWYNIGFAVHDDFSSSRFHHVSVGYQLAFDDEDADLNAIGK